MLPEGGWEVEVGRGVRLGLLEDLLRLGRRFASMSRSTWYVATTASASLARKIGERMRATRWRGYRELASRTVAHEVDDAALLGGAPEDLTDGPDQVGGGRRRSRGTPLETPLDLTLRRNFSQGRTTPCRRPRGQDQPPIAADGGHNDRGDYAALSAALDYGGAEGPSEIGCLKPLGPCQAAPPHRRPVAPR